MPSDPLQVAAIILAAGASRRMGRPKQLLPIGGRSLLRRVVDAVVASQAKPVMVVLGAHAPALRPELDGTPVHIVDNAEWQEGLASSIRTALRSLASLTPPSEAIVLIPGDQPNLTPGAIASLVERHRTTGKSIVASSYDGHPGPPALFARRHFPELLALQGPVGAKPLFERHADSLITVDLPELAVDLDTPADYDRFVNQPSRLRETDS